MDRTSQLLPPLFDRHVKPLVRRLLRGTTAVPPLRRGLQRLSRADLLPPAVWKRLPASGEIRFSLPGGGEVVYEARPNEAVGRYLLWRGGLGFEPETTRVMLALSPQVRWFLDVGANTGYYTLLLAVANPKTRVLAFEPGQDARSRALHHVSLNGLQDRCEVRAEALSDHQGTAKLYLPAGRDVSDTGASLLGADACDDPAKLESVTVTTVDEVWGERGPCDLVKIDVEGLEDRVLRGMDALLRRDHPTVIVECNPGGPHAAVEAHLGELGYHFYHLAGDGPRPVDTIRPDPQMEHRNFLCTTRDRWNA